MTDLLLFIRPLLLTIILEGIAAYIMGLRSFRELIRATFTVSMYP